MRLATASFIRALEEQVINGGGTALDMMERAGATAAEHAWHWCRSRLDPIHVRRWTVLAGKGQNGGDALVAARHLAARSGLPVVVYLTVPREELTGAAREQAARLPHQIPVLTVKELPAEALAYGCVIVDGLLGTGLNGPPRPPVSRWIEQVNAAGIPVIALDLPSGLNPDSGLGDLVLTADLTISMGLTKRGLLQPEGRRHAGILRVADIGLPAAPVPENEPEGIFEQDVRPLLLRRPQESHKNRFGHTLVLGGSVSYAGAPALVAEAALRAGCGLATLGVPEAARTLVRPGLNALIVEGIPAESPRRTETLKRLMTRVQVLVCGPGAGRGPGTRQLLRECAESDLPLIIDADGLRELAEDPLIFPHRKALTVLTPHAGEMLALLEGYGLEDLLNLPRLEQAFGLARSTGCWIVFKGQATVVASPDGRSAVNSSGTNGLGTAGTGDVLAGLLAGLLAQGLAPWDALRAGVFLHGRAAELFPGGDRALTADDVIHLFGAAFRSVTPFA